MNEINLLIIKTVNYEYCVVEGICNRINPFHSEKSRDVSLYTLLKLFIPFSYLF